MAFSHLPPSRGYKYIPQAGIQGCVDTQTTTYGLLPTQAATTYGLLPTQAATTYGLLPTQAATTYGLLPTQAATRYGLLPTQEASAAFNGFSADELCDELIRFVRDTKQNNEVIYR
jgi:hypothetical protein